MKNKLLIIAGPTCAGKSEYAIEIAKKYNGEIISCDSMQIYKNCNIGTAKITSDEMQGVTHYMLSIVSPFEEFSVSEYKTKAEQIIEDITSRGKLPILVGGTGLYIQAILNGYSFSNINKNEKIREKYNKIMVEKGKEYLYSLLQQKDAKRAEEIKVNDVKRIIRALEILECGVITADSKNESKYDYLFCVITKNRDKLYAKINNRVNLMIECGLEKEVKNLLSMGVTFENQCMQSIGYKEWAPYFKAEESLSSVVERIKQNTRHYAKRQITWFKHREGVTIYNLDNEEEKIQLSNNINNWLK